MKRILLVDDESAIVEILAARLESRGYHVVKAYDAEEAVAAAESEKPDLILLDNMLPKGSGLGVLEAVRTRGSAMHTPVILMTAEVSGEVRKKALASGATGFISKPINSEELLQKISAALGTA